MTAEEKKWWEKEEKEIEMWNEKDDDVEQTPSYHTSEEKIINISIWFVSLCPFLSTRNRIFPFSTIILSIIPLSFHPFYNFPPSPCDFFYNLLVGSMVCPSKSSLTKWFCLVSLNFYGRVRHPWYISLEGLFKFSRKSFFDLSFVSFASAGNLLLLVKKLVVLYSSIIILLKLTAGVLVLIIYNFCLYSLSSRFCLVRNSFFLRQSVLNELIIIPGVDCVKSLVLCLTITSWSFVPLD